MNWKSILTLVLIVPVLALFTGAGFLAYQVGQTWDARTTDTLISGLVATCGGGAVIIGVLLSILIGVPVAIRMFGEAGWSRRAWDGPGGRQWKQLPGPGAPGWAAEPPQLEDKNLGAWESMPNAYDTWDPIKGEWEQ